MLYKEIKNRMKNGIWPIFEIFLMAYKGIRRESIVERNEISKRTLLIQFG